MALAKNATIQTVDEWTAVLDTAIGVGSHGDISDAYSLMLALTLAPTESVAMTGATVTVQVCYATAGIWQTLQSFTSAAYTPEADELDAAVSAAATVLPLTQGIDLAVPHILYDTNPSVVASEIVMVKTGSGVGNYDLVDPLLYEHADLTELFEVQNEWLIELPDSANWVRVIVNNATNGCNMAFKSHTLELQGV